MKSSIKEIKRNKRIKERKRAETLKELRELKRQVAIQRAEADVYVLSMKPNIM